VERGATANLTPDLTQVSGAVPPAGLAGGEARPAKPSNKPEAKPEEKTEPKEPKPSPDGREKP
jgi:hypothetical protein